MSTPPTDAQQELLLICGMHRSGTSLITKCFEVFGYGLGETLMEPSEDNPKGFFEDLDVVYINDWLLRDNGSYWDAPVFLSQRPLTWEDQHLDAAREIMAGKMGRTPRLAVKDPRVCLLLPFWRAVAESLGVALKLCLVYRNPMDIAASLENRNGLPPLVGLALIQSYWSQLLRDTDAESFTVSYDLFLANPGATLDRISDWLGRPVEPSQAELFIRDFMDPGMRHHRHDLQDLQQMAGELPALQSAAEVLDQRSRDATASSRDWGAASALETTAFSELLAHQLSDRLALLEASTAKAELLEIEYAQRGFEIEDLSRQKADREAHIGLLENRVTEVREELRNSQAFADERMQALEQTQKDFEVVSGKFEAQEARSQELAGALNTERDIRLRVESDLTAASQELAATSQKLTAVNQKLAAASHRVSNLEHDKAALQGRADWLFSLLETDYGRLLQYEQSFLGRLHRLGRRSYRLLTLQRGRSTAYDDAAAAATTFFNDHGLTVPKTLPSKRRQILAMMRYTLAHPASSLRSMSPARFRKVLSVVKSSDAEDLETWVEARFPAAEGSEPLPDLPPIPADEVLSFPETNQPRVSILIPVYNEWVITHRCLWSILQYTEGDYEVIIADDCSNDETVNIADYVTGVTVVRQEDNQRFLKNCNSAAQQARGEFLLLLNNDTTVTEGWLAPLLQAFESSEVGIVGPKLLFPNGKLQEAGGIIWQDASGWNYGRSDDPSRPQYNYVRETDYVSGAALMIRRSLWEELDGFDETFVPAYYEDTDLCFAARKAGYQVVYQPASAVVHYEGMTNGTDLGGGQKQYQVVNQQRFLEKWRDELREFHFPNGDQVNRARDRSQDRNSVLIFDHYVPHYDKDAGSRSTWMYIELMIEMGWRVQFIGANFFPHQPYTEKLQQLGVEVLVGEHMARNLDKWLSDNLSFVDRIFLHRPHVAEQFLPHLRKQKTCPPISFIGHDLHFLRTQREYEVSGDDTLKAEAERWQKRELAVINAVDEALYFSNSEVEALRTLAPDAPVRAMPLYILDDIPLTPIPTRQPEILFVAGFNHPPNIDAALWFVTEILPSIQAEMGLLQLHIAGSNPSAAVLALASDGVTVHGYVSDEQLQDLYRRARCAIVPLRFGAGVKGKVLEAIQYGVPLVTTSIGAEGIPDAQQVMAIADEATEFADAVVQLLRDGQDAGEDRARWLRQHFSNQQARDVLVQPLGSKTSDS